MAHARRCTSSSGTAGSASACTRRASHRVVDLDACLQISPALPGGGARTSSRGFAAAPHLARGVSGWRSPSPATGRRAWPRSSAKAPRRAAPASRRSRAGGPGSPASASSPAARADARRALRRALIENEAAGQRYRSHVLSFFQANRHLLDPFVSACATGRRRGAPVLDLYARRRALLARARRRRACGHRDRAGPRARPRTREENARRAGRANVRTIRGDVGEVLGALPERPARRSCSIRRAPAPAPRSSGDRRAAAGRRRLRLVRPADARPRPRDLRRAGLRAGPAGRVRHVPRHVPPGDGRPADAAAGPL